MARRCRSCGCCLWLYRNYATEGLGTIPDPEPDGWAGDDRIRLVGSAEYSPTAGRILLPDNSAGIRSIDELLAIEHGFIAAKLELGATLGFAGDLPAGVKYRLFFESDDLESNYVYADIEKFASCDPPPGAYVNIEGYWLVTLGKRINGVDSDLAWCMLNRFGDPNWWIPLTRHSCIEYGDPPSPHPLGCYDGYAVHPRQGQRIIRGGREAPLAYGLPMGPTPATAPPGATIHLALDDPPGRHFGIRRMDSIAGVDLPVWIIAAGRTDPPNAGVSSWKCFAPDFSSHNACSDPTCRRTIVTIEGLTDAEDRRWPMYGGPGGFFVLQEFGTKSLFPFDQYVVRQFIVTISPELRSNKPGETDWRSQGEDDPRLDMTITVVERRVDTGAPFYQIDTHYQYVWEISIAVDGDSLDCDAFNLNLDPADATVTDLQDGGSLRDPMTSIVAITTSTE